MIFGGKDIKMLVSFSIIKLIINLILWYVFVYFKNCVSRSKIYLACNL